MSFNWLILFMVSFIPLMITFLIARVLFKSKKRSAESIYKLIDDLEKKYIY